MRPLNWVLLVTGVLLTALGLTLTILALVLLSAEASQRDAQYVTLDSKRYQSIGHAITAPSLVVELGEAESTALPPLSELASIQVRVRSVIPDQPIFVGVGDASEVAAYLDDVPQAAIGGMTWTNQKRLSGQWSWQSDVHGQLQETEGSRSPSAPTEQDIWVASAVGAGTQELTFDLQEGQWTMVVMNDDATRPVWVDLQAGARTELLGLVNPGLLIAGAIGLLAGIPLLLFGATGLGRDIDQERPHQNKFAEAPAINPAFNDLPVYPLSFAGHLDSRLSRGLWLVKWLLAIPHYLVLALLWFALLFTTIAAGITILFTGRYPRSLFCFSVGVLRWNWRVGFYAYLALGTDQYPPFTLAPVDYPADLAVDYPAHLSRGLVLVKWWLLAIPHLIIVGVMIGSFGVLGFVAFRNNTGGGLSLLGVLLLIAAVALLFTGHYLPGIFALVLGINRWVYRVWTYTLLLRDEYPPFRLDQGPVDPPPRPEPIRPNTGPGTATPEPPSM